MSQTNQMKQTHNMRKTDSLARFHRFDVIRLFDLFIYQMKESIRSNNRISFHGMTSTEMENK